MELYFARQPIFDGRMRVFAYELLFRSGMVNACDAPDGNVATSKVINAIFYSRDGEGLLGHKPAFINFPRELLLNDGAAILPPASTVVEVLETVEPDAEVCTACQRLRSSGYRIALDDFDPTVRNPLTAVADFIKVDFRATNATQQAAMVRQYGARVALLAEKLETQQEFELALKLGYRYFQGYFFARPTISATRQVPGFKLNYMRILEQIHAPELDIDGLAALITREPALSYKLLRFVNSAVFARTTTIGSIRQALLYIGEMEIRRWISVILLMDLACDRPGELVTRTLLRARLCELLAPVAGFSARAGDLFVLGLFSLLDVMLGYPIGELIAKLPLPPDIAQVLLGTEKQSPVARLWQLVLAGESGDWQAVETYRSSLGITPEDFSRLHIAATAWTDNIFRS